MEFPAKRERGKPRGIRRDRDCHSCRMRNIKCDLNRPRCLPCVQSGLPCGGYPQRVVWAGEIHSGHLQPKPRAKTMTMTKQEKEKEKGSGLSAPSSPSSARSSVVGVVDVVGVVGPAEWPNNNSQNTHDNVSNNTQYSFLKRLTAFYEQIQSMQGQRPSDDVYLSDEAIQLVSRIWDFALARIQGYAEQSSMDSVRYHVEALMGLNEAIQNAHPIALFGIATFAFFEVCDGSFGEWQCHLHGARSLLDFHCRSRADLEALSRNITGLTDILVHLVWFDTMGAIIRGSRGLIFDDWHRETLNDNFFAMVGCPADTFTLFVELAQEQPKMEQLDLTFLAMDQLLRLDVDFTERGRTASAWRCAAAIAVLTRIGASSSARRTALSSAVDRACQVIQSILPTSGFYIHLAATAYLAGLNATRTSQCRVVRMYWQNCRSCAFPHYPDGEARCEERWRAEGLV